MGRNDDIQNHAHSGGMKGGFNREEDVCHLTLYVQKHVDSQQNYSNVDEPRNCHSSTLAPTNQKQTQNNHPESLCEKETIDSFEACVDNSSGSADDLTAESESSSLLAEGGFQYAHHNSACAGKKSHSDKVRNAGTLSKQFELADANFNDVAARLKCVLDNVSAKRHTVYGGYFPEDWALLHSAHALENVLVMPSMLFCDPGHLRTASIQEKARVEFFRLSTFAKLEDLVVSPIRLAESGFYYDEELDDIICFSCGFRKRVWSEVERAIALVHLELRRECLQANVRDARNVPVRANFPDESSQSTSGAREGEPSNNEEITDTDGETADTQGMGDAIFSRDYSEEASEPRERKTNSHVEANEIYTADEETTDAHGTFQASASQSLRYTLTSTTHETQDPVSLQASTLARIATSPTKHELGGDTPQSNGPVEISATDSPRNPEVSPGPSNSLDASRSPVQPEQAPAATPNNVGLDGSASADGSDRHKIALLDMRRAASAVNSAVSVRLATFIDWPTRGLPRPRSLVIAGFYYMGTGDSVRCFYCGVTLRNWRENDDPWETHVRFRFSCDYVMAVKGEDFIIETQVKLSTGHCISSNLRETETSFSSGTGESTTSDLNASRTTDTTYRDSPSITVATGNLSSGNSVTGSSTAQSPTSTDATCRGSSSSHNVVTSCLPGSQELQTDSEHTATTSAPAFNGPASRLVPGNQAATTTPQTAPASHTTVSREHPSTSNTNRTITDQDGVTYLQNLQNTNRRLRQRVTCRVCRSRSVDTIFLPCGHLCTCEVCAATITECCLCGDRIRGTAHVYLE